MISKEMTLATSKPLTFNLLILTSEYNYDDNVYGNDEFDDNNDDYDARWALLWPRTPRRGTHSWQQFPFRREAVRRAPGRPAVRAGHRVHHEVLGGGQPPAFLR